MTIGEALAMYTSREKVELSLLFALAMMLVMALWWLATRQPHRDPSGVRMPPRSAPQHDGGSRFA